jgi:hypothetical protein
MDSESVQRYSLSCAKQRMAWLLYRMKLPITEITTKTKLTKEQVLEVIRLGQCLEKTADKI